MFQRLPRTKSHEKKIRCKQVVHHLEVTQTCCPVQSLGSTSWWYASWRPDNAWRQFWTLAFALWRWARSESMAQSTRPAVRRSSRSRSRQSSPGSSAGLYDKFASKYNFPKSKSQKSYRLILTLSYHGGTPAANSSSLTDLVSPSLSKSSRYLSLEDIFKQLAS